MTGQINIEYFNENNSDDLFLNTYVNSEGKLENNLISKKWKLENHCLLIFHF